MSNVPNPLFVPARPSSATDRFARILLITTIQYSGPDERSSSDSRRRVSSVRPTSDYVDTKEDVFMNSHDATAVPSSHHAAKSEVTRPVGPKLMLVPRTSGVAHRALGDANAN